jgi:hypothetical protein
MRRPGSDERAIRSQTYEIRGCPRVHLCATHWMMANDDAASLWKLVGIPGYAAPDSAPDDRQSL